VFLRGIIFKMDISALVHQYLRGDGVAAYFDLANTQ
jgi:hypothetical protein